LNIIVIPTYPPLFMLKGRSVSVWLLSPVRMSDVSLVGLTSLDGNPGVQVLAPLPRVIVIIFSGDEHDDL